MLAHFWYWLILGMVLIALESLGFGGFLIGASIAGFTISFMSWCLPDLHLSYQIIIFSFFTIIFTFSYWKFFKKFNTETEDNLLNQRAAKNIGKQFLLPSDLPNLDNRIQLGDTLWKVSINQPLKKGTLVVVDRVEGMVLHITSVDSHHT